MVLGRERLVRAIRRLNVPAWVVSGTGLVLAGLSLWYLIVVRAYYLSEGTFDPAAATLLELIEITLLGSFSLVLVYAGYWLASSTFDRGRLWWTGLWTLIGMVGIVTIVVLANSLRLVQGEQLSEPSFIQTMLLAAGGGAIAGLLIGVSTVREAVQAERARQQRDTLVFVNELLRHNVLNGMQVIQGNVQLLEDRIDAEGRAHLETTHDRSETIVELIQNVRVLVDSVSRENPLYPVSVADVISAVVDEAREVYPEAELRVDVPDGIDVRADELLGSVFENLISNAVEHNDSATPTVGISAAVRADPGADSVLGFRAGSRDRVVEIRIVDDGPGIPEAARETCFDPGVQDDSSVGQGLGLYLVHTLVMRYGGDVRIADGDDGGTSVVIELEHAAGG